MAKQRQLSRFYRRVKSTVLLLTLAVMVIVRGHGFNISKMYNKASNFIEKTAKERKLHH
ncbi:hypothetical protein Vsou_24030 [Vulcanisaeta souniana JCM 11219]|uniref:Uncharacterized protein n=1 Tax=Vulcanisaeta souniana JCM 11219 TaxID=1293586 RepID=A0A830EG10_9CREN|nr:hypothetical protein Vsou_24030 [Vulcanisaeta souniana JCM 11219]GGI79106.1 hypothetical protein GCM10007112_15100 [Vulcanisaeta souniana JCM 11219]